MGTTYTVTANPGNITATSDTSPVIVPGLTNGVEYTFIIKATNELGDSAYSFPKGPVLVGGLPTVPLNLAVTSPNRYELEISFDPPASDGGISIDNYVITLTPGPIDILTLTEPHTEDSLDDATLYSVTVKAHNAKGFGPSTTPQTCWAGVLPGAPTIGAVALDSPTAVSVAFTPPADDGGPPITQYTATSTPGSVSNTGASSPIVVPGLTLGQTYTFHVHATTAIGTGAASAESAPIATQASVPGSTTITSTSDGQYGTVAVNFTAIADNGSPLTYIFVNRYVAGVYQYQSFITNPPQGTTQITIFSVPEVAATFKVYGANAIGSGPLSGASNPLTPYGAAPQSAPTGVSGTSSQPGRTTVTFTGVDTNGAPNGGYRIQCYQVTTSDGKVATQNGSVLTTAWYPTGGSKTATVRAVNQMGFGPASSPSSSFVVGNPSVPYLPGTPTITSAASNSTGTITVYFNAPSLNGGGGGISNYLVEAYRGGYAGPYTATGTSSPITISGLVSGAHYRVAVAAFNSGIGWGAQCDCSADIVVL